VGAAARPHPRLLRRADRHVLCVPGPLHALALLRRRRGRGRVHPPAPERGRGHRRRQPVRLDARRLRHPDDDPVHRGPGAALLRALHLAVVHVPHRVLEARAGAPRAALGHLELRGGRGRAARVRGVAQAAVAGDGQVRAVLLAAEAASQGAVQLRRRVLLRGVRGGVHRRHLRAQGRHQRRLGPRPGVRHLRRARDQHRRHPAARRRVQVHRQDAQRLGELPHRHRLQRRAHRQDLPLLVLQLVRHALLHGLRPQRARHPRPGAGLRAGRHRQQHAGVPRRVLRQHRHRAAHRVRARHRAQQLARDRHPRHQERRQARPQLAHHRVAGGREGRGP